MAKRATLTFWCVLAAVLGTGCVDTGALSREDREKPAQETAQEPAVKESTPDGSASGIEQIDSANLPPTDRQIGPLDGGHLTVSVPETWYVPPRDQRFVARMQALRGQSYPSIMIRGGGAGADIEGPPVERIDANNVAAYAEQFRKELMAEGKKLKGGVRPIRMGDFYGVAYERGGKAGETRLDRLLIVRADHDRRYVTELRVYYGTLSRYRKFAYAVAAGLQISADAK